VDRWPNVEAKVAAAAVFRRLDTIDPASIGAECGGEAVPFLRFDQNAQAAFNHWRSDLEYRLRAGDLHSALEAHLAKYRSLIPSLALVCHLVDDGAGPVSEAAMMRAAAWGEYLEGHARRLYASITHADADAARRLAERIKRGDLPDAFSSRNVWRPGWSGLSSRQAAQAAVDSLIDLNWLAAETRTTGGRSAKVYQVNPKVRALANALD
jgi:putative DNA primase/helicase